MIYSFDYTGDFAPVRNLINTYDVERVPTLVINGERYESFLNGDDLRNLVDSY